MFVLAQGQDAFFHASRSSSGGCVADYATLSLNDMNRIGGDYSLDGGQRCAPTDVRVCDMRDMFTHKRTHAYAHNVLVRM